MTEDPIRKIQIQMAGVYGIPMLGTVILTPVILLVMWLLGCFP